MKIAVTRERQNYEKRVAITPEIVKKFISKNVDIIIESNAGISSNISDSDFKKSGAKIINTENKVLKEADILLSVSGPNSAAEVNKLPDGIILIGFLNPLEKPELTKIYAKKNITAFAMELIPRISRAQNMDALSSQSNLAGYRSIIEALSVFTKALPMMITAAGTIAPAKVLVLGAGVAGLQAIATAKRMGAIVSAFDVRPSVEEQVKSLGGKFIKIEDEEETDTDSGYAKEMSDDYQKKQSKLIHEHAIKSDIIITTALIPGKPAPILITKTTLDTMKKGSIVVDMAVDSGGNCESSSRGKTVTYNGVTIIGNANLPSMIPEDSSALYARNIYNFLIPFINDKGNLNLEWTDEIILKSALTKSGKILNKLVTKGESDGS
tara:strand:- start:1077 stop:2219 length:1143 start_codon:yes stop_codon:yes gene_type:complete